MSKPTIEQPPKCSGCACDVGDAAKVSPVTHDGAAFCPPCFVGKKVALDPGRWGTVYGAFRCQFCAFVTLSIGNAANGGASGSCGRCGKPAAMRVPAKE